MKHLFITILALGAFMSWSAQASDDGRYSAFLNQIKPLYVISNVEHAILRSDSDPMDNVRIRFDIKFDYTKKTNFSVWQSALKMLTGNEYEVVNPLFDDCVEIFNATSPDCVAMMLPDHSNRAYSAWTAGAGDSLLGVQIKAKGHSYLIPLTLQDPILLYQSSMEFTMKLPKSSLKTTDLDIQLVSAQWPEHPSKEGRALRFLRP
ncbi:hypothetical protein K0504_10110 [Neiella marina]|uniref:Uncharacterized protein n=1 Tax=Neiella holothuriorum TaxID=2870530 RepID=A0ABS7EIC4_9GAMM|nr:hypothetical protein [Neiella holothuriorum]MBW8191392.1 hypothetical protein [Neiella holothuriorum]